MRDHDNPTAATGRTTGTRDAETGTDGPAVTSEKPGVPAGVETPAEGAAPDATPDPRAGLDREVGDLEDPDAEDAGALPGRAGGGLAGG